MSVLQMCHKYYHDYRAEQGHPPKQIRMYKCEFDSLKDEVKEKLMMPYTSPGPDKIYGMEIVIIGGGACNENTK